MRLAVIPARGGSKRVPRKNIRAFCGKPMIAWSIDAAIRSGCFDHVIVSTDDEAVADIARGCGAAIPFRRPAELADDNTPTSPVVAHAIEASTVALGRAYQVCCLYATAPFVSPEDLRAGLDRLAAGDCSYVFPVTSYAFPIQRALRRRPDGQVEMFSPENFFRRSQDLEEAWHDAGQFYWATAETWLSGAPIFGTRSVGLPLPRHRVQDIDTEEDWHRAELMFNALNAERSAPIEDRLPV